MKAAANNTAVTPSAAKSVHAATGLSLVAAVGAGLAATCCVLPIALTILGLGGTWLAFLGFFAANRPVILAIGLLLLAIAAVLAVRHHRRRQIGTRTIVLLVVTSILLGGALTAPLWERDATRFLWNIWTTR